LFGVCLCAGGAGSVTTQQAVMLTRCTGSLLAKHTPEERRALCDQVSDVLESVGGKALSLPVLLQ